jgi:hypothetical protein
VPVLRIDYATPEEVLPGMRQGPQTGLNGAKSIAKAFVSPSSAAATSYPAEVSNLATLARTLGSSSTTKTGCFEGIAIGTSHFGFTKTTSFNNLVTAIHPG